MNITGSHVATLIGQNGGAPSIAIREDGAALIVGPGIEVFTPGGSLEELDPDLGEAVPIEAALSIRDGKLRVYGGTSGPRGIVSEEVLEFDAKTGKYLDRLGVMPQERRGACLVKHGNKDVLFGGMDTLGSPTRSIMVCPPSVEKMRVLRGLLPASCGYLQAGKVGDAVFLLGSGIQDWQSQQAYDILARQTESGHSITLEESDEALIGVCAVQVSPTAFFEFGGGDANGSVVPTLSLRTNAGIATMANLLNPDGSPHETCFAQGMYVEAEKALYLIGGTNGSPYSNTSIIENRILRFDVSGIL